MLEHVGWLKAFSGLWKAILDHFANWVSHRKPKLYVHFQPGTNIWCIAHAGPGPSAIEYMQVVFTANLTHDDLKQGLIIVDAYPVGTASQVKAMDEIIIPHGEMVKERVVAIVGPVIATKGKAWTGKFVLVDQFQRKHKTQKATFMYVGPEAGKP